MYEETACFDQNPMTEGTISVDGFSVPLPNNNFEVRLSMEELSYHHHNNHTPCHEDVAIDMGLQQHLAFNIDNNSSNNNNNTNNTTTDLNNTHLIDNSYNLHEMQGMDSFNYHQQQQHQIDIQNGHQGFDCSSYPATTPDLLNLFNMPRCSASSFMPNPSISFSNPTLQNPTNNYPSSMGFLGGEVPTVTDSPSGGGGGSVFYDPVFHLNHLPQQPPLFRELFQSLPNGYTLPGSRNGSLFGTTGVVVDDREGCVYQDDGDARQFENVLEFTGKPRDGETKHFATERHRRQHLNQKYTALRSLVPNPTKNDRASVVGDAIEYIKELLRTVNELKLLVEKKRCGRERSKRLKTESEYGSGDLENCSMKPLGGDTDQSYNGSLRSSWLQRKSKDTEVDVRIIDDEVTIKLVQRKNNCLLFVSKVLDDLQLDLHHVAGGHIGDFYSFLFNTKIYEGSSVYASAIANKLIEVVDKQCAAIQPTSSY